jgi:release factor glutamine methyltransferase
VTVAGALSAAAERLGAAGVAAPAHDAELLLRHVLGWDRARLLAEGGAELAPDQRAAYDELVRERARRRPLQHLTGRQWFWRHEFRVTPDVLIPRPETELLVEVAGEALRAEPQAVVVDVGTGSGCIALSLAAEWPKAQVFATEISAAALAVARDNAARLGLSARVRFLEGDLLEPVAGLAGRVDLVVSNPPYVDASELSGLAPEVRDHEPRLALVPPGGRYTVYRRLAPLARDVLRPGGLLVVELGQGMADEVAGLCVRSALDVESIRPDLTGTPRVVAARQRDPSNKSATSTPAESG